MNYTIEKPCSKCGEVKYLNHFGKNKNHKDGYRSICKKCRKIETQIYYKNNKEKENIRIEQWVKNNPEKEKLRHQKYYNKNKEKIKQKAKEWSYNNKGYWKKYVKNKRHNDFNYHLKSLLRNRIKEALKLKNSKKAYNTIKLLSCSIPEFRKHLESLFTPEMNWNNYGSYWEIDHILPCSAFQLQHSEEQEICFAWWNMQPLEKMENKIKSNNIL